MFDATHRLLGELIRDGSVQRRPHRSSRRAVRPGALLRDAPGAGARTRPASTRARSVRRRREDPVGARAPAGDWTVHGTTGYNFLNDLNGIFVDAAQARRLRRVYAKLTGRDEPFDDVLYDAQAADHGHRDGERAERARAHARPDRRGQPQVARLHARKHARRASPKSWPASRCTAPTSTSSGWTPEDRAVVERRSRARAAATRRWSASLFDFFREVVLPRDPDDAIAQPAATAGAGYPPADAAESARAAAVRDEVPAVHRPGAGEGARGHGVLSLQRAAVAERSRRRPVAVRTAGRGFPRRQRRSGGSDWPLEMLATATHDTKLGEDVRARINVALGVP